MAAIAIGYPAERTTPPEDLHDKEQPNARTSTREFEFEGRFLPR